MEKYLKDLEEVVSTIKNSDSYQKCIFLKEKMRQNDELLSKIEKVKNLQKKYIRSSYDSSIKEELEKYQEDLMSIPIYEMYQKSLEEVNQMIDYVRDSLNDYFYELLNEKY